MVATTSNHYEILALHEGSSECVWLKFIIQHIQEYCGMSSNKKSPVILYEDNSACVAQVNGAFIKGDRIKNISPKFFYTYKLTKNGEINVKLIK